MASKIAVLATLETKQHEAEFLKAQLLQFGIESELIDVSLKSSGEVWDGARKLKAMERVGTAVGERLGAELDHEEIRAVVGIGGGTGGEIILKVLRALPFAFPKLLVTTLPFDPRGAVADNSIIIIPTLADIVGLNATLRQVLTTSAAMISGICEHFPSQPHVSEVPSIGITALGATSGIADNLLRILRDEHGAESTVFHANGFGGAAFARFAQCGAFSGAIDTTCHELNRWLFKGAYVEMPDRFTAAAHLPQIILPGGLNFLGLGPRETLPDALRERPHYRHSSFFTHVKLTPDEMEQAASALCEELNKATAPLKLIVPMGGFSHQDRPGGAIEDAALRTVFFETAKSALKNHKIEALPFHINDALTANHVIKNYFELKERARDHA